MSPFSALSVDSAPASPATSAYLLYNGLIVDGQGTPAWRGDLLIVGERIAALAATGKIDLAHYGAHNAIRLDCSGQIIAPGFIDVHTHDDALVLEQPDMLPKISQGITTVVVGNCGISLVPLLTAQPLPPLSLLGNKQFHHSDMAQYAHSITTTGPRVNVAALVGHTALRMQHMSELNRPATDSELQAMCQALTQAMQAGALGLSSGVFYAPAYAADMNELVTLAKTVAQHQGIYVTHIRDELAGVIEALHEAADTAKQAGLPLVLSHHKCAAPANWGRTLETLPLIEKLAQTQPLALDAYPYTAGSTVLREDLVDGIIEVLITGSEPYPCMAGRYLADIAQEWGVSQQEAAHRLQPGGACYFQMRQDDVDRVITHPLSMIGSDGLPHDKRPHPRLWGTFPRILALYWREKGLLSLEQAIHKMSGLSAKRFQLQGRGVLAEGYAADVVLIDPERVRDRASFESPQEVSEGIDRVWVNGTLSYLGQGELSPLRAGRFLKRNHAAQPPR